MEAQRRTEITPRDGVIMESWPRHAGSKGGGGGRGRTWLVLAPHAKTHTLKSGQWGRKAELGRKPLVIL